MNVELNIDSAAFEQSVMAEFARVKIPCQAAMANTFAVIVHHNFGQDGEDRPEQWPILSKKYANQFHGGSRIPTEVLTGSLQSSIEIDETSQDAASVFTNNEYAVSQQFGDTSINLPARPFFPIINGEVTSYTTAKCLDACKAEMERSLR